MERAVQLFESMKSLQLSETMQSQWLTPSVITYRSMISACAKGDLAEEALQLFKTIQSQWLTPL